MLSCALHCDLLVVPNVKGRYFGARSIEFHRGNAFVRSWAKYKRKILEILSLLPTIVLSSVAECLLPVCATTMSLHC